MIGNAIEWYDFFVYGTSAVLVLGPLFLGTDDPLAATLLAFSTFGVGFLARPIGAATFGGLALVIGAASALAVGGVAVLPSLLAAQFLGQLRYTGVSVCF